MAKNRPRVNEARPEATTSNAAKAKNQLKRSPEWTFPRHPLEDAKAACEQLARGEAFGKIVLTR